MTASWDILVVGAGPAGLAAAVGAAESGRRVAIVDSRAASGGQIWRHPATSAPPRRARAWLQRLERLHVEILTEATVVDVDESRTLIASTPRGTRRLTAERLILATGARELFLPFPGWTLPGVLGVGALQALVKSGLEVSGKRIAVVGSGPLLPAVAQDLRQAGAQIVVLAEQAPTWALLRLVPHLLGAPRKALQLLQMAAALREVTRAAESWPIRALDGDGGAIRAAVLRSASGRERTFEVDYLACGFGLVPETRLAALLGCARRDGRVEVDDQQRTSVSGIFCAGESTGVGGVDLALAEGEIAGRVAARQPVPPQLLRARKRHQRFADALGRAFAPRPELLQMPDDSTLICRCEDVPWEAIRGAVNSRDAKLRHRCGMGACQGRICGPALRVLCGWPGGTPRPPLFPISLDAWTSTHPES